MKNKILTLIMTFVVCVVNAQIMTVNSNSFRNNGAVISTVGGGIDNNGTIENSGKIIIDGNYVAGVGAVITNESDTIFVNGGWDNKIGDYQGDGAYVGTIVLNGLNQLYESSTILGASDVVHNLVITNGNVKTLNGSLFIVNDLKLDNGIVETSNSAFDTLGISEVGGISGTPGATSHVNGPLYRQKETSSTDLFFPVGNGTLYRPVSLLGITAGATTPAFGFEAIHNLAALPSTEGYGVETLNNGASSFVFRGGLVDGDYNGDAQIKVSYDIVDGLNPVDQNTFIVTRSISPTGTYNSYDVSDVTANSVTSMLPLLDTSIALSENYFLIGRSANMRASANVILDGAYDTGGTMLDGLMQPLVIGPELESRYLYGSPNSNDYGNIKMLQGYKIPAGAVDVISLALRSATAGPDLDVAYAWLLDDNSIVDFGTGTQTYVTFKEYPSLSPGADYYVVARHRNHLPVLYSNSGSGEPVSQDPGTAINFDLTDINNIYGGGAKIKEGVYATMYPGNADVVVMPNEINALDLFRVGQESSTTMGMFTDHDVRDINLDGDVNQDDWDITSWSNDQLYFTTVP